VITGFVVIVAVCYLAETLLAQPAWGQLAYHAMGPQFQGANSLLLASGILGATVMPHDIFLHSSLTQGRIVVRGRALRKRLLH
jgi:manganese transport protein